MANIPNTKTILYIERTGFTLYRSNNAVVSRFTFPPTAVHDLEVINSDELESQIKLFLQQNSVNPSHLLCIVGDTACFQKEFPPPAETPQMEQIESFINNVPFEHSGYRIYNADKKSIVIATNSDLYGALERSFSNAGFILHAVVPFYMVKFTNKTIDILNETTIKSIFKQFDSLKTYSFLQEETSFDTRGSSNENKNKKSPPTLFILLGIFGFLLVVLTIVFIQSQKAPPPIPTPSPVDVPVNQKTITASESATPEASPQAQLLPSNIRIQIINASGVPGPEEDIKNALSLLGFTSIKLSTGGIITSTTHTVIFTEKVPTSIRDNVISATQEKIGEVSAQEGINEQFEVIITISKKP